MASIQIVFPITEDSQGISGPPSLTDLYPQWGWTPVVGLVRMTEIGLVDEAGTQGVYEVTGPQKLIDAIKVDMQRASDAKSDGEDLGLR